MSWQIINELLGLALIDQDFCQNLLKSPIEAIEKKGFQLTVTEREALRTIAAQDIYEFSQIVLTRLAP